MICRHSHEALFQVKDVTAELPSLVAHSRWKGQGRHGSSQVDVLQRLVLAVLPQRCTCPRSLLCEDKALFAGVHSGLGRRCSPSAQYSKLTSLCRSHLLSSGNTNTLPPAQASLIKLSLVFEQVVAAKPITHQSVARGMPQFMCASTVVISMAAASGAALPAKFKPKAGALPAQPEPDSKVPGCCLLQQQLHCSLCCCCCSSRRPACLTYPSRLYAGLTLCSFHVALPPCANQ